MNAATVLTAHLDVSSGLHNHPVHPQLLKMKVDKMSFMELRTLMHEHGFYHRPRPNAHHHRPPTPPPNAARSGRAPDLPGRVSSSGGRGAGPDAWAPSQGRAPAMHEPIGTGGGRWHGGGGLDPDARREAAGAAPGSLESDDARRQRAVEEAEAEAEDALEAQEEMKEAEEAIHQPPTAEEKMLRAPVSEEALMDAAPDWDAVGRAPGEAPS